MTRAGVLSSGDLLELVTDVGPVPMNVGVALLLAAGQGDEDLAAEVGRRLADVPRLRQHLETRRRPRRPAWADDGAFDVAEHVTEVRRPGGDLQDLLDVAARAVTTPLDRGRPLWRALVVTGLAHGQAGVVVVLHHVVADGVGGLAVLGRVLDPAPPDDAAPRTPRARTGTGRGPRARVPRTGFSPACSLLAPTGPRRRVVVVETDLDRLRSAARAHDATVNDALLVAVGGALDQLLRSRGERVPALVVSVPVATRPVTAGRTLGNQVGVMPVRVPLTGTVAERLAVVARTTAARKRRRLGATVPGLGLVFRVLARVGLFRPMVDHQRLVSSFLSNLRGPTAPVHLCGREVLALVPVTVTAGNVTVAFAALSYAGRLRVAVVVDPDRVPEAAALAAHLSGELAAVSTSRAVGSVGQH